MGTGVENRRNRRASIGPSQKGIEPVAPGQGETRTRRVDVEDAATDCDYGKQPERKNTRLFRLSMTRYNQESRRHYTDLVRLSIDHSDYSLSSVVILSPCTVILPRATTFVYT